MYFNLMTFNCFRPLHGPSPSGRRWEAALVMVLGQVRARLAQQRVQHLQHYTMTGAAGTPVGGNVDPQHPHPPSPSHAAHENEDTHHQVSSKTNNFIYLSLLWKTFCLWFFVIFWYLYQNAIDIKSFEFYIFYS